MELLEYIFFRNALIGTLLACVSCGIIGTYIVTRRLLFISGGITHSSFGGVGLGMYFSFSPTLGAFIFAAASALGIQWLGRRREIREDSAIAMLWVLGMTIGVIFCFMTPGYTAELTTYLFGNILTINNKDIVTLAAICTVQTIFTAIMYRAIISVAFDKEFARSRQLSVNAIETTMMIFIALTIVACLRIVGVILVISLLTIPQMTAMIFTGNYKKIIALSILLGYAASAAGLLLSFALDIPGGASVILCSIALYAACAIGKSITRKLAPQ
ncbi:MAG: metal ABC transporter permease [Bacteroidaceae bacterium]|nr:metal ABC transporter permease [Bacteroidaceae bacterium]MBQ5818142.1 metal ABC transporter permease [Bacteroidaceae bacterium]